MPLLSACLIVKNEASDLPRCLRSLKGVADEVVVVDTGSHDDTPRLARTAGARVIEREWTDDFAAARNVSLEAATGAWLLVIDADEALDAVSGAALRGHIQETEASAVRVVVRNQQPPGDVLTWRDDHVVRVVRNRPEHRFRGMIHEQILPSVLEHGGRVDTAEDVVLMHYGYARATAQQNPRAERNLALLQAMLERHGPDAYLRYHEGSTLMALRRWEEAERALREAWDVDQGELGRDSRAACACRRAQLALRRSDAAAAADWAKRALQVRPEDPLALYVLGVAAADLGAWVMAGGAFEQLLQRPELASEWRGQIAALLHARRLSTSNQGSADKSQ